MVKIKFKEGDKVMAKWPGTLLYYHATIKSIDDDEESAEVLFEDGTEMEIRANFITSEKALRTRSKSRERRLRPRSRSRSRSPARKKTVPVKKSARGRPTKTSPVTSTTTESSSEESKPPPQSPSRTTVTRSRRFDQTEFEQNKGYEKVSTTSYQAKIVVEKVNDINFRGGVQMDARQRANETVIEARKTIESAKKAMGHKYEFGGPFGVLFQYLIIPAAVVAFVSSFGKAKCELLKLTLKHISRDWRTYYDPMAILIVLWFLLFHAIIYALPLGQTIEGPKTYSGKKTEYRISAFYTLFFTILAYSGLLYMNYPVISVYNMALPMATFCCALAFVFNIALQIKSYFVKEDELNPAANTGCTIYDMFMGRELHPRLGRHYQLKLLLYRPAMTAWILMDLIYLQKEIAMHGAIRPAVGIVAGTQIVYCIFLFFWDETQAIYSFDIKNEGLGFQNLIGNLAIVPFVYTSNVRYLLEHQKETSLPMIVMATVFIILGLALLILSAYQKLNFRLNPYDLKVHALESLPPSKKGGRRLLVSGYWGFVRHPNYLGEILLGIGYGLVCGFSDPLPWVYAVFVTGLVFHRALRVEARSKEDHGYAWTEYCKRVPYRVLPFVF